MVQAQEYTMQQLAQEIAEFFAKVKSPSEKPCSVAFSMVYNELSKADQNKINDLEVLVTNPERFTEYVGMIPRKIMSVSPELRWIDKAISTLAG